MTHDKKRMDLSIYDLFQRRPSDRKPLLGSTRPLSDDPYSAATVDITEKREVRTEK